MRTRLLIATAVALSISTQASAAPGPESEPTLVPLPADMATMEHYGRYCATYVRFAGQEFTIVSKLKRGQTRDNLSDELKKATFCDAAAKDAYKQKQMAENQLFMQQMRPIMMPYRPPVRVHPLPGGWKKK